MNKTSESNEEEPRIQLLRQVLVQLGEHFDTVAIFAQSTEGSKITHAEMFRGNDWALVGQMKAWLKGFEFRERAQMYRDNEESNDEE